MLRMLRPRPGTASLESSSVAEQECSKVRSEPATQHIAQSEATSIPFEYNFLLTLSIKKSSLTHAQQLGSGIWLMAESLILSQSMIL